MDSVHVRLQILGSSRHMNTAINLVSSVSRPYILWNTWKS
jgi:hypothetical protein